MKTAVRFDGLMLLTLVGLGVGVYVYSQRKAVVAAVNPNDPNNLAYSAVNAIGSTVTDNKDFSLGSWIYDMTHAEYDPNA